MNAKLFYKYLRGELKIKPCTNPNILLFENGETLTGISLSMFKQALSRVENSPALAFSKQEAIDRNVCVYITSRGCRHGHAPIMDLNNQCVDCTRHTPPPLDGRASPMSIMMRNAPGMVITREAAIQVGFTVYRDGSPCYRGHRGYRYVGNNTCVECQRIYRR